jgi:hypothetical protein|tara:strand:- start:162 stop:842 length:681 start_codon:yes stop_codon:yes gene_type:complete
MSYTCKYCNKTYRKESTLAAHLCEPKRRWQQEKETGVQFGLRTYLQFFETTQGSAKNKSYVDFIESPYYKAFVKFGRHCVGIKCINIQNYTQWLLKNNKKLDYWTKDVFYDEWMREYLKKEAVQDALERALKTMEDYASNGSGLAGYKDYFRYGNANRICHHISTGRISPWIVFNCVSGVDWLSTLGDDQISVILPWIDPDYWNRKFIDYMGDVEWTKHILTEAGL